MPKLSSNNKKCKGTFIDDQTMYWLDLPSDQRFKGLESEVFRLAGIETDEAHEIAKWHGLASGNPWKLVPRYDVLYDGQRQDGQRQDGSEWKYLCVSIGAGTGKTMAAEQTEYLLAEADSRTLNIFLEFAELESSVNAMLGSSLATAVNTKDPPLLIKKLQSLPNMPIDGKTAWELLQQQIIRGKLTLVVDAIDQFKGKVEQARKRARMLREFLQRHPSIRCVVTGRPYAIKRFRTELFEDLNWDYVQLGQFTEEQAKRRVNNDDKWNWLKRQGNISTRVPRCLDVLVGTDASKLGDEVRSISHLYLKFIESLISDHDKQLETVREDSAWYLFALLAFEMITDPNGPFRGQGSGISSEDVDDFKYRVWEDRKDPPKNHKRPARLKAAFKDYDSFDTKLGQLGQLNEMLDDPVIAGNDDDPSEMKQIFWRDQTLQDMFAALWMTRWATEDDVETLRSRLFVRWREETAEYEDMWRLATEMPAAKHGRRDDVYIRSMSVLYEPSTPERLAVRSTEMIWRSWQTLESIFRKCALPDKNVLNSFPQEFLDLVDGKGDTEAKRICSDFHYNGFEFIDAEAAKWIDGDRDVDGKPLPVVTQSFEMAKYTVTNELYFLFDLAQRQRYVDYGRQVAKTKYAERPKAPVIVVDWYDAWCFARWVGGDLPDELEWEYACRSGSKERFSVGDGQELKSEDARFGLDYGEDLPTEVDDFESCNAWGLHQMHGNVWEWCGNWDGADELFRCLRGGSFGSYPEYCRSASRSRVSADGTNRNVGVRVSRVAMK